MGGYVLANVGTGREVDRTDYVAPGFDPDEARKRHLEERDVEDVVPADWEGDGSWG